MMNDSELSHAQRRVLKRFERVSSVSGVVLSNEFKVLNKTNRLSLILFGLMENGYLTREMTNDGFIYSRTDKTTKFFKKETVQMNINAKAQAAVKKVAAKPIAPVANKSPQLYERDKEMIKKALCDAVGSGSYVSEVLLRDAKDILIRLLVEINQMPDRQNFDDCPDGNPF